MCLFKQNLFEIELSYGTNFSPGLGVVRVEFGLWRQKRYGLNIKLEYPWRVTVQYS